MKSAACLTWSRVILDAVPAESIQLAAFRKGAAKRAEGPFGHLLALEETLSRSGFHAMSPWWRSELERFYASGKRWAIFRVGRGGGKSTGLVRLAVAEALFADRTVPQGQRWIWPFISATTVDAKRRIVEIQAILHALGFPATVKLPNGQPTIETNDAGGNPIAFVSVAGTVAQLSGPSTIGATIDEEAKLRDRAHNANPASEILASLVQTFRARPGIRAVRCSSAFGKDGSHYHAVEEGDNEANFVARIGERGLPIVVAGLHEVAALERSRGDLAGEARILEHAASLTASSPCVPTWLANPTISAVASRQEVDALPTEALDGVTRAAFWLRENASVPLAGGGGKAVSSAVGIADRMAEVLSARSEVPELRTFPGLARVDPRHRLTSRARVGRW